MPLLFSAAEVIEGRAPKVVPINPRWAPPTFHWPHSLFGCLLSNADIALHNRACFR